LLFLKTTVEILIKQYTTKAKQTMLECTHAALCYEKESDH